MRLNTGWKELLTNKTLILKEALLSKELIYYNIIFWSLIFTCSELMGFPSVLLTLISLIIMMVYMEEYDRSRFDFSLKYFIIIPLVCQLTILFIFNLGFHFNLGRAINLIKFNIRWMHLIITLYLFTDTDLVKKIYTYAEKMLYKVFLSSCIFMAVEISFLFFGIGYEYVWGDSYFKGYFYNTHVNSYFLIVPMVALGFCYFKFRNKVYKAISFILATSTIVLNLMTGARTSSVVAIALYFVLFFSGLLKNKKLFIKISLAAAVLLIVAVTFGFIELTSIPLVKKTIMVLDDPSGFLNGRNYIWNSMLTYQYKHFNIINILLGMGLGESFIINYAAIRQALWAHNDLLETFNGLGLYGLITYSCVYFKYFQKNKSITLAAACFILLFFNGLFPYSELVNFIPFITMVFLYKSKGFSKDNQSIE